MLTVWQVAAGAFGRDYTDLFLKHGLVFLGGESQVNLLRQVAVGDLFLLKKGLGGVAAVGRAVTREGIGFGMDESGWLADVDGWDLSHYYHVEWHRPAEPISTAGLLRGTLFRTTRDEHRALAEKVLADYPALEVTPPPQATRPVSDEQIIDFLIEQGLRSANAEELFRAFHRIRLLGRYYYQRCPWDEVQEYETRSFLILPLLFALGWSEQHMKIELRGIDVACFEKPYISWGTKPKCRLILESKGYTYGLSQAAGQAFRYANEFPECRQVVVSNGYCYKVFRRQDDSTFSDTPWAYLNLLRPRDRYPLDPEHVGGALEVFGTLMPRTD
jgi:hypothetical protein